MNNWQKRRPIKFTCKSGNEVTVRRSSPSVGLKGQRFLPVLKKVMGKDGELGGEEELKKILELPDADLEDLTDFAGIVLADAVVDPPVATKPKGNQLAPSDIPVQDFWETFFYVSRGCPDLPVKTKEGETTVETVSTFPDGQEQDTALGAHGEQILPEALRSTGDSGRVDSVSV